MGAPGAQSALPRRLEFRSYASYTQTLAPMSQQLSVRQAFRQDREALVLVLTDRLTDNIFAALVQGTAKTLLGKHDGWQVSFRYETNGGCDDLVEGAFDTVGIGVSLGAESAGDVCSATLVDLLKVGIGN